MPISVLNNNIFRIQDLTVGSDNTGYYISMSLGHCAAAVLCVSQRGSVAMESLLLSQADLQKLFVGGKLDFPEQGYVLQGITRQQLAGAGRYRNFRLIPPAHVQVWGMTNGDGGLTLWYPESAQTQQCLVPMEYDYALQNNELFVQITRADGYQDGDLMYQVGGHWPIPIPAAHINQSIPLRPGVTATVFPASGAEEKYILKRSL